VISANRWKGWLRHLVTGCALVAALGSSRVLAQDEWTFMVYMDGDNNLEDAGVDDFLEIASEGSTATVNILVLFDRVSGYYTGYGDWTDARRGRVNNGDTPTAGWGVSVGEVNMGDPQTLIDFVEWGIQNYPAQKYCVVLWNHGGGWRTPPEDQEAPYKAVCWDETSSHDCLYMNEVRSALATIEADYEEVDLVGFDACLMAMAEVGYEIRNHTSCCVGSEKGEPNDGWPYDLIMPDLTADPTMSVFDLGQVIVDRYYQSFGNSEILSEFNLSSGHIGSLAVDVDALAQRLRDYYATDRGICGMAARQVCHSIEDVVLHEQHGTAWPDSHGMAIYFPADIANFDSEYNSGVISFCSATRWEEFLSDFYSSMGGT